MTVRILEGLLWSLGGLVVGYSLCWFVTEMSLRAVEESVVSNLRGRRAEAFRALVGLVILALVLLTSIRYYQATSCQTEYNTQVAEALRQRSEAQGAETFAQIQLLTTENPTRDPEVGRQALARYVAALQELERVRAAHPIPEPPKCGGF